jgi:short-subunit dehydrogenase
MRAARRGRIVNVSSMGGRLTFPFGGYYHASKHAVEALSDALRYEVRPFGINVSIIEPGLITTRFGATASATLAATTRTTAPASRSASIAAAAAADGAERPLSVTWRAP